MYLDDQVVVAIEELLSSYSGNLGDIMMETRGDDREAYFSAALEHESIRRILDHIGYQRYQARKLKN